MTFTSLRRVRTVAAALLFAAAAPAVAEWPMFGGSASRNFANTAEKNILSQWCIAKGKEQNVKWKATLGGNAFGGPVVAGGRIFVGTNNFKPHDKNITKTGRRYWVHDLGGGIWASPCYVDGKVYMGVDNGDMLVFAAGKEDKLLNTIEDGYSLKVAPVAANGVLYVNNGTMLYAIGPQ